jgi:hypothetical protein
VTAETDLPINDAVPAPTKIEPGNLFLWNWRQMQVYAQACVAHATASKDAEIEALRAEVERLQSDTSFATAISSLRREKERAERLAQLLDQAYGYVPAGTLADQIHCALLRYQEEGSGAFWGPSPKVGGPDWTGYGG